MTFSWIAAALALTAALPLPELRWRHVGPFRGGRTKAASGVPGKPGLYYIGAVNGGVWRTDDYGRTWSPLFDAQPTGSVGAIAVAPSAPEVLYVGSGEGLHRPDLSTGDGLFKSLDGGKTWQHLGLRDAQQIAQIAVDPRNADRLFVAVLGHPYGPNAERGLYRSLDGGRSFEKVLGEGPDTGAIDVVLDPRDAQTVYAVLWEAREAPWENGEFTGPGSGLFKSTDGGTHWTRLSNGLPTFEKDGLSRIGITVAPSQPSRLFATVAARQGAGLYRSDDAGASWRKLGADPRVTDRGDDFAEVKVDPTNPDIVYTASVVVWKSTDGGEHFSMLRGSPGGDDYQRLWIDPHDPRILLVASDQGAIVTVNGGATWSSWYNQPTAQMFHVNADNAFPYRVCGGQQESGSACVATRGAYGAITFRDWTPVDVEEYGYAVPDPLDPDVVYGGKISRFDRRTGQGQDITPLPLRGPEYRVIRTAPIVFSPVEPRALYFGANTVWKTLDGGRTWAQISPDLTRTTWAVPRSVGKYTAQVKPEQRGVVYALSPSPVAKDTLWAGTDDGLVHVTHDGGKTWTDVTPRDLEPWAKVSIIDAGHSDAQTAYVAVNTLRLDDLKPRIYRTHDGGKTWARIVAGLPLDAPVDVVREDPKRPGLLYCGTEKTVHVSFDDGEHWQPLRLDLPATSIRDLVVKDDDLAIATHGRGFWILDDVSPLRQLSAQVLQEKAHLFRPAQAVRVRWNVNTDTPLPPDEPAGQNPPDGAVLDYFLQQDGEATLEVLDAGGALVRRFSSRDVAAPARDIANNPAWWLRPARVLPGTAGLHRFVWDLHYTPPAHVEQSVPMSAVVGDTPLEPRGPWALPGRYTVRLRAAGLVLEQPLELVMDPRVKTPPEALARQHALALRLAAALEKTGTLLAAVQHEFAQKKERLPAQQRTQVEELVGTGRPRRRGAGAQAPSLTRSHGRLEALYRTVEEADAEPMPQVVRAAEETLREADDLTARLEKLLHKS